MENFTAYTNLIEEAVVIDDYTVEFRCSKPKPDMIRHWVPILPEHVWGEMSPTDAGKNFQNPPPIVGSGPFKCRSGRRTRYIKMVKNPTWWGAEPTIDEIYFMYFTNADTMVQDLKAGNIDGSSTSTASQMGLFENNPEIEARAIAIDGFNELGFNCYDGSPAGLTRRSRTGSSGRRSTGPATCRRASTSRGSATPSRARPSSRPTTTATPTGTGSRRPTSSTPTTPRWRSRSSTRPGTPTPTATAVREYDGEPIELGLIARVESTESQQLAKLIAGWFKDVGITVKVETMDEGALMDQMYNYEGDTFTPELRHVPLGLVPRLRPRLDAELLHQGPDRELERLQLVGRRVRGAVRAARARSSILAKRKEYIDRMQQILYEQTPYIVTDYGPDFEAFNTEKWEGYIFIPDPNGNALIPPFGNGGYANFLSIQPKTAEPRPRRAAPTRRSSSASSPRWS